MLQASCTDCATGVEADDTKPSRLDVRRCRMASCVALSERRSLAVTWEAWLVAVEGRLSSLIIPRLQVLVGAVPGAEAPSEVSGIIWSFKMQNT